VERWHRRLRNALDRMPQPEGLRIQADTLESLGKSLLAHRHLVKPGMTRIRVPDYSLEDMPEVEIALDPARSFQDQVQERFHKATKLRRTALGHDLRVDALKQEMTEAEGWRIRLGELQERCQTIPREDGSPTWIARKDRKESERSLETLKKRLLPRGLWPQPPRKREEAAPSAPLRFELAGGWILWAGRSGTENDLLTTRIARADDLWFHAAHVPGSHVILRSPTGNATTPPPALLELAAGVAAWLSKLRAQEWAEVHVTARKHVHKPRKAPAGSVTMDHFKVLRVKPQAPP
jgi:predicted ribosome quality control (RQC) complex YloA/Tae2 family protein